MPIKATNTQRVTARLSPPIYLSAKLSPDSNKTTAPADNHFPATRDKKIIGIGGKKKKNKERYVYKTSAHEAHATWN